MFYFSNIIFFKSKIIYLKMVRDEGFEPPIMDSESMALPLGESRISKIVLVILLFIN